MPLVDKIDFLQMQMPENVGPKKFAPKSWAISMVYYGEVSWRAFQIGLLRPTQTKNALTKAKKLRIAVDDIFRNSRPAVMLLQVRHV
jgi:hypothetical protein